MLYRWLSLGYQHSCCQTLASVAYFSCRLFINVLHESSLYKGLCRFFCLPLKCQRHCKLWNDFETAQTTLTLPLPQCAVIAEKTALISCTQCMMHTVNYILFYWGFICCAELISPFIKFWLSSLKGCVKTLISSLMQNKNACGCLWDFPCCWKNRCPQVVCKHYITANIGQCGMELQKTRDKKASGGFLLRPAWENREMLIVMHWQRMFDYHIIESKIWSKEIEIRHYFWIDNSIVRLWVWSQTPSSSGCDKRMSKTSVFGSCWMCSQNFWAWRNARGVVVFHLTKPFELNWVILFPLWDNQWRPG